MCETAGHYILTGINQTLSIFRQMSLVKPVGVHLSPVAALTILGFLLEFEPLDLPQLATLREAVDEFKAQISDNITDEQLQDANAQIEVNILLGKSPKRPKNV